MKSFIAESVTYLHPDKICDQISDNIVDMCLEQDPYSRVAIETVGGHGHISVYGELTTKAELDISKAVKKHYLHLTGKYISVDTHAVKQSSQISKGVDIGGAGDQGVMVGYACNENDMCIPHEMYLCRKLLEGIQIDGKSQVTIANGKIESVVMSVQNHTKTQLRRRLKELKINPNVPAYLNNTGAFTIGGFDADSGCTGRKIVVDAYGPRVPVGGGAFSGKDATKVDRSAAYMARWIALHLLYKHGAHEVFVRLGYVIGGDQPLIKQAIIDGKETTFKIDCRPEAIIDRLDLRKPIYTQTAKEGHFGFIERYSWESNFK